MTPEAALIRFASRTISVVPVGDTPRDVLCFQVVGVRPARHRIDGSFEGRILYLRIHAAHPTSSFVANNCSFSEALMPLTFPAGRRRFGPCRNRTAADPHETVPWRTRSSGLQRPMQCG